MERLDMSRIDRLIRVVGWVRARHGLRRTLPVGVSMAPRGERYASGVEYMLATVPAPGSRRQHITCGGAAVGPGVRVSANSLRALVR
jgi:hypothetical protein